MLSFWVFNTFYIDFILSIYFKMIDIVFPTEEDAVFMGLNIFAHDFVHDFNTVKFGPRLSKISSHINKLREFFVSPESGDLGSGLSPEAAYASAAAAEATTAAKEADIAEQILKTEIKEEVEAKKRVKVAAKAAAASEKAAAKAAKAASAAEKRAAKAASEAEKRAERSERAASAAEKRTGKAASSIQQAPRRSSRFLPEPEKKKEEEEESDEEEAEESDEEEAEESDEEEDIQAIAEDIMHTTRSAERRQKVRAFLNMHQEPPDMNDVIEFLDFFRTDSKLYQQIIDFINETKLYVIGNISSGKRGGGITKKNYFKQSRRKIGKKNRKTIRKIKSNKNKSLRNKMGGKDRVPKEDQIAVSIGREEDSDEASIITQPKKQKTRESTPKSKEEKITVYSSLESSLSSVIGECSGELADYFKFLGLLYLFYKSDTTNPFKTLNLGYIEDMLIIYLLSTDNTKRALNENKAKTHEYLSKLQLSSSIKKGGKMTGGTEPKTFIDVTISENPVFITLMTLYSIESDVTAFNEFVGTIDIDEILAFVNDIYTQIIGDKDFVVLLDPAYGILKRTVLKRKLEDINNQKRALTGRGLELKQQKLVKSIIDLFFNDMFNPISDHINKLEARLNAPEEVGSLSSAQKTDVQMISIIVSQGGLKYILPKTSYTNNLLLAEIEILKKLATTKPDFGTVDNRLKDAFIAYADEIIGSKTSPKILTGDDEIELAIAAIKQSLKKGQVKVINNASPKEFLEDLGLSNNIICPTSSTVDAMGTTGSCYNGSAASKKKEFHNMDFQLRGPTPSNNYYRGKTEIMGKNLKITFEARFNEFVLPPVEVIIDMSVGKIINLSANTTFKSVLNKIITIWTRELQSNPNLSEHDLWKKLNDKSIFIELVSCGAIKSVGDYFQEINSVAENGGYADPIAGFTNDFRIGANGDQPSGVRAGYIRLKARSGFNENSMAGYFGPGDFSAIITK